MSKTKTYLSVRSINTLESLGALSGALATLAERVDGVIGAKPADGRFSDVHSYPSRTWRSAAMTGLRGRRLARPPPTAGGSCLLQAVYVLICDRGGGKRRLRALRL